MDETADATSYIHAYYPCLCVRVTILWLNMMCRLVLKFFVLLVLVSVESFRVVSYMIKACISMVCITALGVAALVTGQDGVVLATALAAVAGIGGYAIGKTGA